MDTSKGFSPNAKEDGFANPQGSYVSIERRYEVPRVEELGAVEDLTHGKDTGTPEHEDNITIIWGNN